MKERSPEHCQRLSEAARQAYAEGRHARGGGWTHSEATKRKIAESHLQRSRLVLMARAFLAEGQYPPKDSR
jgi:hypothetical protein